MGISYARASAHSTLTSDALVGGSGSSCSIGSGLEHVQFFPRQVIGAEDLTLEHDYLAERMRRHNRFLHGWG